MEIRWSDLDPNQHLANSGYMNFMSATRMKHMVTNGVSYADLKKWNLGPVVLREEIHYFKEVFPGKPIYVSQEVSGLSEEGTFYRIRHNFYNYKGENFARGVMTGTWIDMNTRKITPPHTEIIEKLMTKNRCEDFKTLNPKEMRLKHVQPKDIELSNELDWFEQT